MGGRVPGWISGSRSLANRVHGHITSYATGIGYD